MRGTAATSSCPSGLARQGGPSPGAAVGASRDETGIHLHWRTGGANRVIPRHTGPSKTAPPHGELSPSLDYHRCMLATSSASSAATPLTGSMIKGAGVLGYFEWWNESGEKPLRELVHELDPEFRRYFNEHHATLGILASSRYPAEVIHAILDRMQADKSDERMQELIRSGAHAMIRGHLSGIYRFLFLTFMNPDRYARSSQKLFSRYMSEGRLTKVVEGPGRHVAVLRDWMGHHPHLCDASMYGGECVYRMLGCEGVEVEKTACVSRGDAECSWVTTWDA